MDRTDEKLLADIADLHGIPEGSYNIRKNGESIGRVSSEDVEIISKTDRSGIDIIVKPNVKNRSVHIPVIITVGNFTDLVYNDFHIGENADVTIVAGCGIHNDTSSESRHDGIHTFYLGRGSRVRYVEKHLGGGVGRGGKILNPVTNIKMDEDSVFEMESVQLGGVTYSDRKTNAVLKARAGLMIREKILTTDAQTAITNFKVKLSGAGAGVEVISRSVAKDSSRQKFNSDITGLCECFGHVQCDAIIVGSASVSSTPKIDARSVDASLVHEAAIGRIAGEQLIKLMTLGLDEKQAEDLIIKGFLN